MAVTFFNLKPNKKSPQVVQGISSVELVRHFEEGKPATMTYIDNSGEVRNVDGGFTRRSDGSYILEKTTILRHPIYEKTEMTYKDVDAHFSYFDSKGEKRVFNNLDTLQYDEETNSYTGIVEEIEYENIEVEVFAEK